MSVPGMNTPGRFQGREADHWDLEWTYSDTGGTPVLDTAQSCRDARVATPVADGGPGITTVRFPKCRRAWLVTLAFEPASEATDADYRNVFLVNVDPAGGAAQVRLLNAAFAETDPAVSARVRLTLRLEYQ